MPPRKLKTDSIISSIDRQEPLPESYVQEERFVNQELERQIRLEELKTLQEKNRTLAQNNEERKRYAKYIFGLTSVWAILIFVILFCVGFKKIYISDTVVITLITSTTINFFVFFVLVIKYLFNTKEQDKSQKKSLKEILPGTVE